jgi:predicted protein tyrosine phosphatase
VSAAAPPPLVVEVCSRDEAGAILSSPEHRSDVCFLISIGEPQDEPPAGYASVQRKLRLLFSDTVDDDDGPTEDDVRKIIAAAHELSNQQGRVLIHCQAGISRSSAAAVILYAILLGPGKEAEAVAKVIAQRPIAHPNRKMIELADRLLGRGGALVRAVGPADPWR